MNTAIGRALQICKADRTPEIVELREGKWKFGENSVVWQNFQDAMRDSSDVGVQCQLSHFG